MLDISPFAVSCHDIALRSEVISVYHLSQKSCMRNP
jgi:hypothetical protein